MNSWTTKAHQLRQHQAAILVEILQDLQPDDPRTIQHARPHQTHQASAGDLRGIPAIGRGVAGAIPGSSPHAIQ
jgi:hypothetical protein